MLFSVVFLNIFLLFEIYDQPHIATLDRVSVRVTCLKTDNIFAVPFVNACAAE